MYQQTEQVTTQKQKIWQKIFKIPIFKKHLWEFDNCDNSRVKISRVNSILTLKLMQPFNSHLNIYNKFMKSSTVSTKRFMQVYISTSAKILTQVGPLVSVFSLIRRYILYHDTLVYSSRKISVSILDNDNGGSFIPCLYEWCRR